MPKGIDFRIAGMTFEAAGRRLATAKLPPASKPAPKRSPKRKKR